MSENLDLVRSIYADWERGDWSSAEWADPEIEWVQAEGLEPGSWTGVAAMKEAWRSFGTAWDDFRAEVEDYRELEHERVLVLFHRSGSGKTSGLDLGDLATKGATVFDVNDGKVVRIVAYWDRDHALTDLGIKE
jgi:ketosteroid isomerase-like protein